jgi:hypothetical protein
MKVHQFSISFPFHLTMLALISSRMILMMTRLEPTTSKLEIMRPRSWNEIENSLTSPVLMLFISSLHCQFMTP